MTDRGINLAAIFTADTFADLSRCRFINKVYGVTKFTVFHKTNSILRLILVPFWFCFLVIYLYLTMPDGE
jgi:hypothetical protein